MADFVAVIRKAVDGLANNTPENRAKVYEKARSAVVRQLESMKPRPPEELLNRQIVKLDTAIAEVESEYADALPPLEEEEYSAPAVAAVPAPYVEEPAAPEPYQPHVEDEVEPARSHEVYEEDETDDRQPEPEPEEEREPEVVEVPYVAPVEPETPAYPVYAAEEVLPEPAEEPQVVEPEYEAPSIRSDSQWAATAAPSAEDEWQRPQDDAAYPETEHDIFADRNAPKDGPLPIVEPVDEPFVAQDGYRAQETYAQDVTFGEEPKAADAFGRTGSEPAYSEDVFEEHVSSADRKASAPVEDYSSYFQDATVDLAPKANTGLPRADADPFAEEGQRIAQPGDPATAQNAVKDRTPWDDLEDLIGYDGAGKDATGKSAVSSYDSGLAADGIPASYMVKKKPRRNYAALVLSVLGLLLIAGGGYALWLNRDAMNDMVGGLVSSAQPDAETTDEAPATETPATTPTTESTPPAGSSSVTTPPANDGSVTGTKFTQRLLTDGTERDEGPAAGANGQPVTAEGQSVYEQNEAPPADGAAATPAQTPGAAPAGTAAAQTPPAAAPVAGSERMFLYEEVLGQTVPTAIEGSVAWSLQNENDAEGRPSPTVQGNISVPGRGLTALITFKRNTDPSLPASHLVEIVFSVNGSFEGGAIDSVQRIAMKRTEQDRGNALIAVPAKITDDFHMIALNDFPDALRTNLELLGTRDWIDIPVSYRNGRRALLTMQKGAEGKRAFEEALREWGTASPATSQ